MGNEVFNTQVADKLLELSSKTSITIACMECGVGRRTYYNWIEQSENDPESEPAKYNWHTRAREARALYGKRLIAYIQSSATPLLDEKGNIKERGDWRAAAWICERDFEDYKPESKVKLDADMKHSGSVEMTADKAMSLYEAMLAEKKAADDKPD